MGSDLSSVLSVRPTFVGRLLGVSGERWRVEEGTLGVVVGVANPAMPDPGEGAGMGFADEVEVEVLAPLGCLGTVEVGPASVVWRGEEDGIATPHPKLLEAGAAGLSSAVRECVLGPSPAEAGDGAPAAAREEGVEVAPTSPAAATRVVERVTRCGWAGVSKGLG